MPDISMCSDGHCPKRKDCYRHPDSGTKPQPQFQAWGGFRWAGYCEGYWPTRREEMPRDL